MSEDTQQLQQCRDACERVLAHGQSTGDPVELPPAVRDALTKTMAALDSLKWEQDSPEGTGEQAHKKGMRRRLPTRSTLVWLSLDALTIVAFLVWYEVWPVWNIQRQMQGRWQFTAGVQAEERLRDVYFQIIGRDTWLTYPGWQGKWDVQRSRIQIRPARDFFIVTRHYDFGGANRYHTEYIVRMVDDRLYRVRGMARLDGGERKIDKLRRVKQLPPEALTAIEATQ